MGKRSAAGLTAPPLPEATEQPDDPRNWSGIPQNTVCTDQSEEVEPVTSFVTGQENQLMILRACVKFQPVFPTTGLGKEFEKDGSGRVRMISSAVFVQEPN